MIALGHRLTKESYADGVLTFTTGMSHRSMGERMTLWVLADEGYGSHVVLEAGSTFQLIQWGAKRKVATDFFAELDQFLDALEHGTRQRRAAP